VSDFVGGERGIRTLGTLARTHDFQSCTFGHSVISPERRELHYHDSGKSVASALSGPPIDLNTTDPHVPSAFLARRGAREVESQGDRSGGSAATN
jgi:hypothetical protein